MSFINYASREINCKIVYYGPGLCGKTHESPVYLPEDRSGCQGQDDQPCHRNGAYAIF